MGAYGRIVLMVIVNKPKMDREKGARFLSSDEGKL